MGNILLPNRNKFTKRIFVTKPQDFFPIDSSFDYFLDGVIDMTGYTVEIPPTGISISGYSFDLSGIVSNGNNTIFYSESCGNLLMQNIFLTNTDGKLFDIESSTGFEAIEINKVNFTNSVNVGDFRKFRQGFMDGVGFIFGKPSITLHGNWSGGFKITNTVGVGIEDTMTEPIFKEGLSFTMQNRFLCDANFDLGSTAPFTDFQPSNFPNSNTFRLIGASFNRNGVIDQEDTTILPNISSTDVSSYFKDCQGIKNTIMGGIMKITTEATQTMASIDTYYDVQGTFTIEKLDHFTELSNGVMRYDSNETREFTVTAPFVIESNANDIVDLVLVIYRDSTGTWEQSKHLQKQINSLPGFRDTAEYTLIDIITLNQNDRIKMQYENKSSLLSSITAELDSYVVVIER